VSTLPEQSAKEDRGDIISLDIFYNPVILISFMILVLLVLPVGFFVLVIKFIDKLIAKNKSKKAWLKVLFYFFFVLAWGVIMLATIALFLVLV